MVWILRRLDRVKIGSFKNASLSDNKKRFSKRVVFETNNLRFVEPHQRNMNLAIKSYSLIKLFSVLFVISSLITFTSRQSKKVAKNVKKPTKSLQTNFTIDRTKPSVYIDFVRLGEEEPLYSNDLRERVYLKLVNNSKWSIFVGAFVYGKNEEKPVLIMRLKNDGNL